MKNHNLVLAKGHIDTDDCLTLSQVLNNTTLSKCKTVWVDCEQVTSISTDALHLVLNLSDKATSLGIPLLFYQLNPALKDTVKEEGLYQVLNILPTITDANNYHQKLMNQAY
ncbi:STAS domain-containing protein [Pontibacter silvestris]|uniref:STAS domain-containing protein n=2 Tax=Pontibacter silvestris TaxID=2305183 RepID=A0ABW4WTH9_9BACT|nr:STAS domain-containing protein [Pontibacter silvestris]MCC9138000.1 STAS domain-containing protein [Pontibacter silvestris]